jgi:agmatinase
MFLIKEIVKSGLKIIGFDLCEVGNAAWGANVGARILYQLSNWAGHSHGLI